MFEYKDANHTNFKTLNMLDYKYINYLKHSKKLFEDLYNLPINSENLEELKLKLSEKKKKLNELLIQYKLSKPINQNINRLQHKLNTVNKFTKINKPNQNLFKRFMKNVSMTEDHNNPPVYHLLDSELPQNLNNSNLLPLLNQLRIYKNNNQNLNKPKQKILPLPNQLQINKNNK